MVIIRFILLVLHIIVLGLLFGSFLNAYIPPKVFPFFNFLSLSFPVILAIHLIITGIWVLMWKKRAFVFIFISVFFFNPMKRWVNFSSSNKGKTELKTISLNARNGMEGEEKIANFIQNENPDIIFIQEGYYLREKEAHFDGYYKNKGSEYLHIFSKYPIVEAGKIYSEDYHIGNSIYADIDYNGKTIRLINFYLEPFQLDNSERQAENIDENYLRKFAKIFKIHQPQVTEISSAIKNSPYPMIVAGDMNAVPNSYEYYQISKGLQDSFEVVGNHFGATFWETIIPIKIDYIFSSKDIKPLKSFIYNKEKLSDHSAIISEFSIK